MKSIKALSLLAITLSALSLPAFSSETVEVSLGVTDEQVVWVGGCYYEGTIGGVMQTSAAYIVCQEEKVAKAKERALNQNPKIIQGSVTTKYSLIRKNKTFTKHKNTYSIIDLEEEEKGYYENESKREIKDLLVRCALDTAMLMLPVEENHKCR